MKNKILLLVAALIFTAESIFFGHAHADSCTRRNALRPLSTSASVSPDSLRNSLENIDAYSDQFLKTLSRKTDDKGRLYLEGRRYNLGVDYAGKDLVVSIYYKGGQPGDFGVFYESKLIASYDARSDQFLKTLSRKTDDKGRLYLEGRRYNLGVDYAGKDLVVSIYYKGGQPGDFGVFYESKLIASYDARSDQFLKTLSTQHETGGRYNKRVFSFERIRAAMSSAA